MIRGVVEEIGTGSGEKRCTSAIALGHDDLVEQLDGGVLCRFRFSLVKELVEDWKCVSQVDRSDATVSLTLGIPKELDILPDIMGQVSNVVLHVELVQQARSLHVTRRRNQVAPIRIEETGEKTHEC